MPGRGRVQTGGASYHLIGSNVRIISPSGNVKDEGHRMRKGGMDGGYEGNEGDEGCLKKTTPWTYLIEDKYEPRSAPRR